MSSSKLYFEVNTFHGPVEFYGFDGVYDNDACVRLCWWIKKAVENQNLRRKDIRAQIMKLKLDGEESD